MKPRKSGNALLFMCHPLPGCRMLHAFFPQPLCLRSPCWCLRHTGAKSYPKQPKQLLSRNSLCINQAVRTVCFALPGNGRWQAKLATICRHSARRIGHTLGQTPGTTPGWSVACSHSQGTQPNRTFCSSSSHGIAFCRYELCSSIRIGFHSKDTSPRHLQISATGHQCMKVVWIAPRAAPANQNLSHTYVVRGFRGAYKCPRIATCLVK